MLLNIVMLTIKQSGRQNSKDSTSDFKGEADSPDRELK